MLKVTCDSHWYTLAFAMGVFWSNEKQRMEGIHSSKGQEERILCRAVTVENTHDSVFC